MKKNKAIGKNIINMNKKTVFISLLILFCQPLVADVSQHYLLEAKEYVKQHIISRSTLHKKEGETKTFVDGNYVKVKYVSYYDIFNKSEYKIEEQIYDIKTGELIRKKITIYEKNYDAALYVIFLDKDDQIVKFGKIFPLKKIIKKPNEITFISETRYFDEKGNCQYSYIKKVIVDYSSASARYYANEISVNQEILSHDEGDANYEEYLPYEVLLE